jgi:hypothetical protein
MPGVASHPCHDLRFFLKTDNILQQEGKKEAVLERAEVARQGAGKCRSRARCRKMAERRPRAMPFPLLPYQRRFSKMHVPSDLIEISQLA